MRIEPFVEIKAAALSATAPAGRAVLADRLAGAVDGMPRRVAKVFDLSDRDGRRLTAYFHRVENASIAVECGGGALEIVYLAT